MTKASDDCNGVTTEPHPDPMIDPQHEPPETEADRRRANIALLIGAIILIGGGIWLVNALLDAREAQICMETGRRNCNPIEAPAR